MGSCLTEIQVTIYGVTITIIKSFMLPKITHLAMILPNLTTKQYNNIYMFWEEFIKLNKSPVGDKKTLYLEKKAGGSGL